VSMSLSDAFFSLHHRDRPLVLCNAWDAYSARLFEAEGFEAIATSSAGVANALGYADGEDVDVDELFAALRRIVRVVRVPVSADLEAGFGIGASEAVRSVERALEAGAVGGNLEDYDPRARDAISADAQCERIRAIKARCQVLGAGFFLNARTDLMLHALGEPSTRVDRTIERLQAFSAAGADGLFAPGVTDAETIGRIAAAVDRPFNVLAGPVSPTVAELAGLGVARVSVGSWPARVAMGAARAAARELRDRGTFTFMGGASVTYDESNALFARASP
jgi:2-methylisocitrate lyase-like PEP mutase family enzyme